MNSHSPGPEQGAAPDRRQEILRRIAAAEARAGRTPGGTRLIAISKTQLPASVMSLAAAGQRRFGENRVQEAAGKIEALAEHGLEWHLVGHLQSNKARQAAGLFHWIHGLDSIGLARKLDRAAGPGRLSVLAQVDLAGGEGRAGVPPSDLHDLLAAAGQLENLKVRGLMLLPPLTSDPHDARPYFRRLRKLAETAAGDGVLPMDFELSMGMSRDFEIAVEEGATMVRVGTALFGPRRPLRA